MRNENTGTYPHGWKRIADRVKRLNGYRCERCQHPSTPDRPIQPCDERCTHLPSEKRRVLTVHHLDGNKSEWHLWNLAALCQVCHLVIQGRVAFHQLWPWPHTPWMARHVARFERWQARQARKVAA
jgi:5-methylcytosine-specific restriction endonuclease McrA